MKIWFEDLFVCTAQRARGEWMNEWKATGIDKSDEESERKKELG